MSMIHTSTHVEPGQVRFGQAWRHDAGTTATIQLSYDSTIHLDSIGEIRELLAAVLGAYQGLARLEAHTELGHVQRRELDTAAVTAGVDCAAACAVDGHVPPSKAPGAVVVDELEATAAAAREILETPRRCGSCGRRAGKPTAPCSACPDYSPAAAQ